MPPIVLDLETQNLFTDVGYDHKKLKISVVGIYDYATEKYETYLEKDLFRLFKKLEHASLLIGFNIKKFDLEVLSSYYLGNVSKFPVLDMLNDVHKTLGFRVALDDLARATLGIKKQGHGLKAIEYFKKGQWDALCQYCLSDVKITKSLYEYGKKYGALYFLDAKGRKEIKVDWATRGKNKTTIDLTLPI